MPSLSESSEFTDQTFAGLELVADRIAGKEFYDCKFTDCLFRESEILSCRFNDCTITRCDLSLARLNGTSFRQTEFVQSRLLGVDWTLVDWPKFLKKSPLAFRESVLDYGIFAGLTLHELKLQECRVKEADFSEADLTRVVFDETDLTDSRFWQTDLTAANFETASNYRIDVGLNKIKGARFSLPEAVSLLRSLDIKLVE